MSRYSLLYKIAPTFFGISLTTCFGSHSMLSEKQQITDDSEIYTPSTPKTPAELSPSILNAPIRINNFKGANPKKKQYISYITHRNGYNHKYTQDFVRNQGYGNLNNLFRYKLNKRMQKETLVKIRKLMETYKEEFKMFLKYFPYIKSKYGNLGLYMFCRDMANGNFNNNDVSIRYSSICDSERE